MLTTEQKRKFQSITQIGLQPSETQIYMTNSYKFKTMEANRDIKSSHVKAIKNSIQENNMTHLEPILVNEKGEIIDGQHRYTACKELGLPIYYIIGENLELTHVQVLNTYSENWNMKAFLESYIKQGNQEYIKLKEFINEFPFLSISIADGLLTSNVSSRDRSKIFQTGELKITHEKSAYNIANLIKELMQNPSIDKSILTNTYFLRTLIKLEREIDLDKLKRKIELAPAKLARQSSNKEYTRHLENIYNYYEKEENKVRFF